MNSFKTAYIYIALPCDTLLYCIFYSSPLSTLQIRFWLIWSTVSCLYSNAWLYIKNYGVNQRMCGWIAVSALDHEWTNKKFKRAFPFSHRIGTTLCRAKRKSGPTSVMPVSTTYPRTATLNRTTTWDRTLRPAPLWRTSKWSEWRARIRPCPTGSYLILRSYRPLLWASCRIKLTQIIILQR